jgi:hypothetical protein
MNWKKRGLVLMLALSLVLCLAACGNETSDDAKEPEENVQEETQQGGEQSTAHGGEADEILMETEDGQQTDPQDVENLPAQEGEQGTLGTRPADQTEKPAASTVQKPTGSTAQKPSTPSASKPTAPENQKPVQKPAEESSKDVDLTAFYESLPGSVENWPSMMAMSQESVDAFYPGLSDISTKQCSVYMAMISANVGEIALVQVENAGDVQKVKDIFQARIDYQVGDETNPGGAWYPATIEGWKNDSRIVSNGNYVMLIAVEGADSVVDSFNALFA